MVNVSTARELIQQKYKEVMTGRTPLNLSAVYPAEAYSWNLVYAAEKVIENLKREHYENQQALLRELVELEADAAMSKVYESQLARADKEIERLHLEIAALKNGYVYYPITFTYPPVEPYYTVTCCGNSHPAGAPNGDIETKDGRGL